MQDAKENLDRALAAGGIGLLLALLVMRGFLSESFWLDETISAWIVGGTPKEAFERAFRYQGQSPLYYLGLWGWAQVGGHSELSLRIPSLLFLGSTLAVVYYWLRLRVGVLSAALGVVVLLGIDSFVLALSARSYAAGLLAVVLSLFYFDRGLVEGSRRKVWLGAFALALACYFHFLFALVGVLVPLRGRKEFPKLVLPLTAAGLACLPLLSQFLSLAERREALTFLSPPALSEAIRVLFPLPILLQLAMAGAVVLIFSSFAKVGRPISSPSRASDGERDFWMLTWWILPTLILWLLARLGAGPFVDRYVIYTFPALAIIIALASHRLLLQSSQRILFCSLTVLVAARFVERQWKVEDWRGAFAAISSSGACTGSSATLLVYSGLVELEHSAWREDRTMWSYLVAPASIYGKGISVRPLGLTSDFESEVGQPEAVCGVVLLKRAPPPQALNGGAKQSSEQLIVSSLESALKSVGLKLEPLLPGGAIVAAYRVRPRS
jgi:hypothetical protein